VSTTDAQSHAEQVPDRPLPATPRLAVVASSSPRAQAARDELRARYPTVSEEAADVVVALGGDGLVLDVLHRLLQRGKAPRVYGMNRGTTGFLLNEYDADDLPDRVAVSLETQVHPLRSRSWDVEGAPLPDALAFNEVTLRRVGMQSARIEVAVDGTVRLDELVGDGLLVATPAGSTAYNLSARGPILPLGSNLLALTPICALRPRRWPGALLTHDAVVQLRVLDPAKRPVSLTADQRQIVDVGRVEIAEAREVTLTLMFDSGRSLADRVVAEQFST